jgi:hypothetical protein
MPEETRSAGLEEITPDTKDWTWAAERPCGDCGFDPPKVGRADVGARIRANADGWAAFLEAASSGPGGYSGAGRDLWFRQRGRWSALEYACHVRDVHRLYLERLNLMLDQDDPLFQNWDQDTTAVEDAYQSADPGAVGGELLDAAEAIATVFDSLPEEAWARTSRRSDGAKFTMDSFARYYLHDPVHHLWDVAGRSQA